MTMTEQEYRDYVREQREAQAKRDRAARGEPEPERGYDAGMPSQETSLQKLHRANLNSTRDSDFKEPELTDAERGMSPQAFARLSSAKRLEIWNRAMLARRQVIAA